MLDPHGVNGRDYGCYRNCRRGFHCRIAPPCRRVATHEKVLSAPAAAGEKWSGRRRGAGHEVVVPHRPEHRSSLSSSAHDSPLSPRLRKASLRRARAASTESSVSRGTDANWGDRPGRRTSAILNYADMMLVNAFLPAPNSAVERVQKLQRKARKYADFTAEQDRRMRIRNANPFRTMAEQRWKETQRLRERRIKEAAKASADSREKRGQRRWVMRGNGFTPQLTADSYLPSHSLPRSLYSSLALNVRTHHQPKRTGSGLGLA